MQVVAVLVTEPATTPEQSGRQAGGTPLRVQQGAWFLPPAPQRSSFVNSPVQAIARALSCAILAS